MLLILPIAFFEHNAMDSKWRVDFHQRIIEFEKLCIDYQRELRTKRYLMDVT